MKKNLQSFPKEAQHFLLSGPAGQLEIKTDTPEENAKPIVVICCHPHPLYQGTMENKVVTTTFRSFFSLGCKVVRFNFRGVGESTGSYGDVAGECDDLRGIIQWVKTVLPSHQIWLAGFSFGSFIAFKIASESKAIKQLLTIAPPVNHFPFDALPIPSCPWLVIQGDEDEVVPAKEVYHWLNQLTAPPQVIKLPDVSHFFHGQLILLKEIIIKHYKPICQSI